MTFSPLSGVVFLCLKGWLSPGILVCHWGSSRDSITPNPHPFKTGQSPCKVILQGYEYTTITHTGFGSVENKWWNLKQKRHTGNNSCAEEAETETWRQRQRWGGEQTRERTHRPWHTVISEKGEWKERMNRQAQVRISCDSTAGLPPVLSRGQWLWKELQHGTGRTQLPPPLLFLIKKNSLVLSCMCKLSFSFLPHYPLSLPSSAKIAIILSSKHPPTLISPPLTSWVSSWLPAWAWAKVIYWSTENFSVTIPLKWHHLLEHPSTNQRLSMKGEVLWWNGAGPIVTVSLFGQWLWLSRRHHFLALLSNLQLRFSAPLPQSSSLVEDDIESPLGPQLNYYASSKLSHCLRAVWAECALGLQVMAYSRGLQLETAREPYSLKHVD